MNQPVYKFSKETPKVSGYYWWKCAVEQPDNAVMINLIMREDGTISSYFIYGIEPSFHWCEKCLFAGPIAEAIEANDTKQLNYEVDMLDERLFLKDIKTYYGLKSYNSIMDRVRKGAMPHPYKDGKRLFWFKSQLIEHEGLLKNQYNQPTPASSEHAHL